MARSAPIPAPAVGGVAVAVAGGPVLPYAAAPRPRQISAEEKAVIAAARRSDLYFPIVLIVLGTILAFYNAMKAYPFGLAGAGIIVTGTLIIDMSMIFTACMIMVKLMDISLGSPGEAILKVCAAAIFPGAIGNWFTELMGPLSGMFVWALTLVLYFILFKVFFDLDGTEMIFLTCIIWIIRTWVGLLIMHALVSGWMTTAVTTIAQKTTPPPPPPPVVITPIPTTLPADQLDRTLTAALYQLNAVEARRWLAANPARHIGILTPEASAREVAKLYDMGAESVVFINLTKNDLGLYTMDAAGQAPASPPAEDPPVAAQPAGDLPPADNAPADSAPADNAAQPAADPSVDPDLTATEIVIRLPGDDSPQRQPLIDWRNNVAAATGEPPVTDSDRRYVYVVFPSETPTGP